MRRRPANRTLASAIAPAAIFGTGALVFSCRAPTEITVHLTTDVPCSELHGTTIAVGVLGDVETKPPATETTTCDANGNIGSLVVVPSGSDDAEITLRIVGGVNRDPDTCTSTADATGCIVARRAVRYIEHTPLDIDVALKLSCSGIVCADDATCVDGVCKSDVVPEGCGVSSACDESSLVAPGAAVDAGTGAGDGEISSSETDATMVAQMSTDGAISSNDATVREAGGAVVDAASSDASDASDATGAAPFGPIMDGGCGSLAALRTNAYWPMYGSCPTLRGQVQTLGPQNPVLLWTVPNEGSPAPAPIVDPAANALLAGSTQLSWVTPTGTVEPFAMGSFGQLTPALSSVGTLDVVQSPTSVGGPSKEQVILSFVADGGSAWGNVTNVGDAAAGGVGGVTLLPNGLVVDSTLGNEVEAFQGDGGSRSWGYVEGSGTNGVPAVGQNGDLYLGWTDGHLTINEPVAGDLLKSIAVGGMGSAASDVSVVIGSDNTAYAWSGDGTIVAIDPAFATRWTIMLSPNGGTVGGVALQTDDSLVVSTGSSLFAVSAKNGGVLWTKTYCASTFPPVIGGDGTIYLACPPSGGMAGATGIFGIGRDGTQKWNYQPVAAPAGPLSIGNQTLYVPLSNGTLNALADIPGSR